MSSNDISAQLPCRPTQPSEGVTISKAECPNHCLSAGLYQRYDQDKRVVAYASKTLLPPELKYTDCEKALLCTVWAIQRFSNYIGAQKVIIETCHQPVTSQIEQLHARWCWSPTHLHSHVVCMALQGRDIEARYAQNHRSALGNGLAACQNCSGDTPTTTLEPEEPQLLQQPTFHRLEQESLWVTATPLPTHRSTSSAGAVQYIIAIRRSGSRPDNPPKSQQLTTSKTLSYRTLTMPGCEASLVSPPN
ncbi:hypothetical protein QQF64_009063 [Cirrhinus molitorella]|uniref:Reverse transcriptase RNase H-like domain-containing protein n=1 Tax=Cirrhinus molitorella TaxID=172907 RepID=A0ABR3M035_9TELE